MKRLGTFKQKGKYNILLVGNEFVGKSSLLQRFVTDKPPSELPPVTTIGVENKVKTVCLPSGVVRLKVWDTSGQGRFKELLRTYYVACRGAVVVYDIHKRESFVEAQEWVTELKEKVLPDLVIVLIGNKVDVEENREVPKSEAEEFAASHALIFMETSSESGSNVVNCFTELAKGIYAQQKQQKRERKELKKESKVIKEESEEIKPSCCCLFKKQKAAPKSIEMEEQSMPVN